MSESLKGQTLSKFLRTEISHLIDAYEECHDCITPAKGNQVEKRPYIYMDQFKKLEEIAKIMKVPVGVVIDRLIIQPMLLPH